MYLKSLEIVGFKSFPEKTVIEFNRGITAIVGPNGSGKSNITDAIRWVLGEQSVRTLRGDKMQDIIFSGTQSRRAMSYAEVSINIDNTDGKLPIDYSEIQVTRRLYRSGESEYLLNKTPCRLKDITSFFMDTGLGRNGYSIVGQGKVDDILSNKPEDRRRVFEEASGIVKYKTRKREAERRLEATEQNLVRIDDILAELSIQIDPLQEQSEKAKTYLRLHDTLRESEISLFLDTIRRSSGRMAECDSQIAALEEQIGKLSEEQQQLRATSQKQEEESRNLEEQIQNAQTQRMAIAEEVAELTTKQSVDRERITQIEARNAEAAAGRKEVEQRLSELEQERQSRSDKGANLVKIREKYEGELAGYETEITAIMQTLGDGEQAVAAARSRIEQLQELLYDKKEQAGQTRGQVGLIDRRIQTLEREIAAAISEKDQNALRIEETEALLSELTRKEKARTDEQQSVSGLLDQARAAMEENTQGLEEKKLALSHREYRITTLEELERNRDGYSQAVRTIMSKKWDGVIGTVGDLLKVAGKYEMAIETALGNAVQNLVAKDEKIASDVIQFLKDNRQGRATFMPLTTVRGRVFEDRMLQRASAMNGFEGVASDLVDAESRFDEIVRNLLGRILIVDSMDHALEMARAFSFTVRIITLEGEVLMPGGSITGGYSRSRVSGILGRAREIKRLHAEASALRTEIDALQGEAPSLENELLEAGREQEKLQKEQNDAGHARIREESRLTAQKDDATRLEGRISMLRAESEQLAEQRVSVLDEAAELDGDAASMEQEIASIRTELEQHETKNRDVQQQLDDLRETVSELRISIQSIVESLSSAQELRDRIDREMTTLQGGLRRQEEDRERGSREAERLETMIVEREKQKEEKMQSSAALLDTIQTLQARRTRLEEDRGGFASRMDTISSEMGRLQMERGRVESGKGRIEATIDEYRNRLWEEYELTYDTADGWPKELEKPEETARTVQDVKKNMRELGDVNLASIEEYTRVSERFSFMSAQRDDIQEAREKLNGVIREITEEMKTLFLEHFRIINENFRQVFSDLFSGGSAEVVLEDDSDVLECGIEIRAQPPGKKLQNLMPLSGGERSLTAIALLFAILKLRPTPFCVLDEIESALDDANIYMFTDYVQKYRDDSQFILVTHRKGTMEAAESIYGVTMQERGISRILSMKLAAEADT